jgi:hypothetical protein
VIALADEACRRLPYKEPALFEILTRRRAHMSAKATATPMAEAASSAAVNISSLTPVGAENHKWAISAPTRGVG